MSPQLDEMGRTFWVYFVVAIPVAGIVLGICRWMGRGEGKKMSMDVWNSVFGEGDARRRVKQQVDGVDEDGRSRRLGDDDDDQEEEEDG